MHVSPEPAITAITDQFRKAGLGALTPLQQRLIPAIFRGRDAAAETEPDSGATTAAVYTLIIGYRGRSAAPSPQGASPAAVLLAADPAEAAQAAQEWARFAKALGRAPTFSAVGESEDARREERRLSGGAVVVAGTPGRIIDYLRRGSLRLEAMETLVVSLPDGEVRESFVRDVQFVLEKCPARRQTVLLGRPPLAGRDDLLALAHHPEVVTAAGRTVPRRSHPLTARSAGPRLAAAARAAPTSAAAPHGRREGGAGRGAGLRAMVAARSCRSRRDRSPAGHTETSRAVARARRST
jgi:hypothetical protein